MTRPGFSLDLGSLRELYKSGTVRPCDVISTIYSKLQAGPPTPVWISQVPRKNALARGR
jgi:hypothetical protein